MPFEYKDDIYVGNSKRRRGGFVDEENEVMLVSHTRDSSGVSYKYFIFDNEIFDLTLSTRPENKKTIFQFGALSSSRRNDTFEKNKEKIRNYIKEAVLAEKKWMCRNYPEKYDADNYIFQFAF